MTSESYPTRTAGSDRRNDVAGSFSSAAWVVLRVGLVAGTLDITESIVFNLFRGITPKMVFQYIASGLIGAKSAIMLGMASVLLGVALHYFIALSWTAIYYAASRKFAVLIRQPAISGILYGGFVYVVMNFVVLPLSRLPQRRAAMTVASRVNGVLALLFCIGLTIALLIARSDRATRRL